MAMVCPQCNSAFDQRLQCPSCNVRLLYQAVPRRARTSVQAAPTSQWQQTPWGRIVVGLMLAQGLYYSLWHFCTAGLLAVAEGEEQTVMSKLVGLVLSQSLQALGLIIRGMLPGASQR